MKTILSFAFLFSISFFPGKSQVILNGSFENNSAAGNVMDMYPPAFLSNISNVYAIDGGYCDLITTSTFCGLPQNGNWFMQNNSLEYYGAFSLELDSTLDESITYFLSFYSRPCGGVLTIDIGFSYYDSTFGTSIGSFNTVGTNLWTQHSLAFSPPDSANYLTVNISNPGLASIAQVDNFVLSPATEVEIPSSHSTFIIYPNPSEGIIYLESEKSGLLSIHSAAGIKFIEEFYYQGTNPISVEFLPVGIYFLQMNEKVQKMVIR